MSFSSPLSASADVSLTHRLEEAVTALQQRWEQHRRHESRMVDCYHSMQQTWTSQVEQMSQQIAMLEGLLGAWMRTNPSGPHLTLVTTDAEKR